MNKLSTPNPIGRLNKLYTYKFKLYFLKRDQAPSKDTWTKTSTQFHHWVLSLQYSHLHIYILKILQFCSARGFHSKAFTLYSRLPSDAVSLSRKAIWNNKLLMMLFALAWSRWGCTECCLERFFVLLTFHFPQQRNLLVCVCMYAKILYNYIYSYL